jgi:hypothetical protein
MDTTPAAASTAPPCARSKSEGVAPLAGAAAVILFVAGVFIHDVVGDTPDGNDPAAEFARYYQQEDGSIWFASIFIFIALALFLWFVGELRAALRQVESGVGRLAATAQAGGVAAAVLIFAGFGTQVSAAILVSDRDVPINPEVAVGFWWVGDGIIVGAFYAAAVLVAASALVFLRSRALVPRWFAWVSLALAILLLLPWINWFGFLGFAIWTLIASVLLWRSTNQQPVH